MRPYPVASGMTAVRTVAFAPDAACSFASFLRSFPVRSGVSPQSTRTVPFSSCSSGSACRTACPVPSCSSCVTKSASPASAFSTVSPPNPTTTILRTAPASFAAASTWASIALPPALCSTFGKDDFMRVPLPAANMTVVRSAIRSASIAQRHFLSIVLRELCSRSLQSSEHILSCHLFRYRHSSPPPCSEEAYAPPFPYGLPPPASRPARHPGRWRRQSPGAPQASP